MHPPSLRLVLLVPAILLTYVGCVDPEEEPPGSAEAILLCNAESLHLGDVIAGQHVTLELRVTNPGDHTLLIGEMTVDGPPGPPVFHVDWTGQVVALPPGSAVTVPFACRTSTWERRTMLARISASGARRRSAIAGGATLYRFR